MDAWAAVVAWGARQNGVVVGRQVRSLGVSRGALRWWVERGRLHQAMTDVFLLPGRRFEEAERARALSLLALDGVALSHFSAAAIWKLECRRDTKTHVLVERNRRLRLAECFAVHRTTVPFEVATRWGLRVTSPVRTLFDLAAALERRELERAFESARRIDHTVVARLAEVCRRLKGRHLPQLRTLEWLLDGAGDQPTESSLESRALRRLVEANLRPPRTQMRFHDQHGYVVRADFAWPAERVVLFVDGFAFHSGRAAFDRDLEQRNRLAALGWVPLAVGARQLQSTEWVDRLREVLRQRQPNGCLALTTEQRPRRR